MPPTHTTPTSAYRKPSGAVLAPPRASTSTLRPQLASRALKGWIILSMECQEAVAHDTQLCKMCPNKRRLAREEKQAYGAPLESLRPSFVALRRMALSFQGTTPQVRPFCIQVFRSCFCFCYFLHLSIYLFVCFREGAPGDQRTTCRKESGPSLY